MNRWIQLAAAVMAMIMISNLQYAWTLFVRPLQEATGWKLSDIQWGFTLFIIFETWIMPIEGWMIDRMGPRVFLSIAGVLCGIGWTALGTIETLTQLYVYYAIAGVGAAFVYSGAIATALKWFPDKRGLASGLITAGFGSGSALFIPLIAWLIENESYRTAFYYTGIVQGLIILLAAQWLKNPPADWMAGRSGASSLSAAVRRNSQQMTTPEMLRTPHFYWLYAMFVMMATGGLLVTAHAGPLAKEWGFSLTVLTAALALDRLSNGGGRIFWGWVSDRIGREKTMAIAFIAQAGSLLFLLEVGRLSGVLFAAGLVLTYFTWGPIFALFPSITGDYFGSRNATSNYSFMYSAKGVASIIGGGLAAMLAERFGGWSAALYGSAALALVAGLMALALRAAPLPGKTEKEPVATAQTA
ncbi:MAG: oxalate/formate MFS antiporter [Acidimicrobiia bacterium]|nr:oxalate/formate MFS antiporter [Acidimicrobiia bacterium]